MVENILVFNVTKDLGALAAERIEFIENIGFDRQPSLSGGALDSIADRCNRIGYDPAQGELALTEEPMFDRMPLGGIRGVVCDSQPQPQPRTEVQQILAKLRQVHTISPTGIEGEQDLRRLRIAKAALPMPTASQRIGDEGTGLVTGPQGDKANLFIVVIDAMGDRDARGQMPVIMVQDHLLTSAIALAWPMP